MNSSTLATRPQDCGFESPRHAISRVNWVVAWSRSPRRLTSASWAAPPSPWVALSSAEAAKRARATQAPERHPGVAEVGEVLLDPV